MTLALSYYLNRISFHRLLAAPLAFLAAFFAALLMTVLPLQSVAASEQGTNHWLLPLPLSTAGSEASFLSYRYAFPQNTYTDDLVVTHEDTLTGDVVVWSGDVTIEEGGEISGNLMVASGDIGIESGGRVEGDVTSLSGDVEIDGKIVGDLSVFSGDVELNDGSIIEGDVSVLSGDVERAEGSQVSGDVRTGPKVQIPLLGFLGEEVAEEIQVEIAREIDAAADESHNRRSRTDTIEETSFIGQLFRFVFRLAGGVAVTLLVGVGAGLLVRAKPAYVDSVRRRLRAGVAANFAVGLLFNMVLSFLAIIFAITCLLLPMTLVSGGLLLLVNGIGWAAIAASIGRRLTGYADSAVQSPASVVLGALVLTAPVALLWATDVGCLRFMGLLAAFIVASAGAGSVLAPWLKRLTDNGEGAAAQIGG